MPASAVHYSSETDDWSTPQDLFDKLNAEFGFDLDVCANAHNAKCASYYDRTIDGLSQRWAGTCWMNPPYGRVIGQWVKKAAESSFDVDGCTVVCLIPARTDTAYWHDWILGKAEVRFIRGRIKFGGARWNAPFPSCVVIFRPGGQSTRR